MSHAQINLRYDTVEKIYPRDEALKWGREIEVYTQIPWATPQLMWWGDCWLEMERCLPILELGPEASVKYRQPLRDLLQKVHEAGYWHRDIDLVNVVVHPTRGVLIIDWENMCRSSGDVSYDLYGARTAGVKPAWFGKKGPDGQFWHGWSKTSPDNYWRGL